MKILGFTSDTHVGKGVVAELTATELMVISGGSLYRRAVVPQIGTDIDICDRFRRFEKVEELIAKAKETPETLRSFATVLDTIVGKAAEAILPPSPATAASDNF